MGLPACIGNTLEKERHIRRMFRKPSPKRRRRRRRRRRRYRRLVFRSRRGEYCRGGAFGTLFSSCSGVPPHTLLHHASRRRFFRFVLGILHGRVFSCSLLFLQPPQGHQQPHRTMRPCDRKGKKEPLKEKKGMLKRRGKGGRRRGGGRWRCRTMVCGWA